MILGATFYWMDDKENKEQPIIKRDYLPDGIVALENAQRIAIAQNQNAINFDHIFWWSYGVIREDKNFPTFSSIVWFNNAKKLDEYYMQWIQNIVKNRKDIPDEHRMRIQKVVLDEIVKNLNQRHYTRPDFCFLFCTSFLNLSNGNQAIWLLIDDNINVKMCMENCEKLVNNPIARRSGVFAFLQILSKIFKDISLDPSKVQTMININDNLNELEAFLKENDVSNPENSVESEIWQDYDQNIDANWTATKKKEEKKLNIEYFGTDLTRECKNGFIDPIIWREKEINQVIYTLLRKTKNNPLLIWEPGVGKTAIVEWLAQRINEWKVPDKLKGKRLFLLDMGTLVAGTKYRGEFEARMKSILDEAVDPSNNIILFIDEVHTIIGAGGQDHNDAAQMLKPMLSRWKIKLIGATTFDEYQKVIEKDAALKRRFQEVVVNEPDNESTQLIIEWLKKTYEDFHGVQISPDAISAAINLSKRYILNKHLPDKALDILDEACARKSTMQEKLEVNDDYQKAEKEIESIQKKITKAIENQDYFTAADLKEKEENLKQKLQSIRNKSTIPTHLRSMIDAKDIGNVLAEKTWIPVNIVNEDEITKLKRLKGTLKESIIGQDEAVDAVVKTLTRSRLSMVDKKKPIGSFLFLGPSGVGKTYLAKLIAKDYFGDESAMIRFDMSEFMEKFSVSKLIWSPAGYVGFEEWGGLTEAVRRKPYSVILFDEIEKASPDVLNILLQILDEWQLKDSKWRLIDFKSTIIIMTSNIGSEEFSKKQVSIGFSTGTEKEMNEKDFDLVKERVIDQLKTSLTPELLNRIDHKVVFRPLSKDDLKAIFNMQLATFLDAWKWKEWIKLPKFTAKQVKDIIEKIYDPQYGARPVERYIQNDIEWELINSVLEAN